MTQVVATNNTDKTSKKPIVLSNLINRIMYISFLLIAGILFFLKNQTSAAIFLCLAPVFDPFDQKVPWGKRPLYQKLLLGAHAIAGIGILLAVLYFN